MKEDRSRRTEGADWDGFSNRSEDEQVRMRKGSVEENAGILRPGFRVKGGLIQGGDAGGRVGLLERMASSVS